MNPLFAPVLLVESEDPKMGFTTDEFEFYGNEEGTHWVSLNISKGLFRIWHNELLSIYSPWESSRVNYEPQRFIGR